MKPYSFVPLLGAQEYNKKRNLYKGKIKLNLEVITPLHISSGYFDEKDEMIYKSFVKFNGKYIIPGSTLKGCVRTIAESISRCCISTRQSRESFKVKITDNRNCIICDMFGAMGKRGNIRFMDLKLIKENGIKILNIPSFYQPKPNSEAYKINGKFKGIKFYHHGTIDIIEKGKTPCEFIMPESIFEGEIFYENIDDNELNLLCFALGLDGTINLKIGYGKPGYYGSIKITSIDNNDAVARAKKYGNDDKEVMQNILKLREILNWDRKDIESAWHDVNNQRGY
ncbi:MAG: RAMP superfamily CRISPR-associated protein [Thermoanaerobacteraceae bacterium]|nr:RAMP superfamily CRISPR-associated protein [Thermoanaerobacteraceae bacterium]